MSRTLYVFHTESIYSRGGEKYLYELLKHLVGEYRIIIYFERVSQEWMEKYTKRGITVRRFVRPGRFYWSLLPFTLLVNYLKLRKEIKRENVVFATNFPLNFLATLLTNRTIIHCFEPLAIFYDPIRIKSLPAFSSFCVRIYKILYSGLDKYAVRNSSALTILNESVEPYVRKTYGRSSDALIPNGVDTKFFTPNGSVLFKKRTGERIIGHSTDYTVFKGTDVFLKSLPETFKNLKHVRVVITESIPDPRMNGKYRTYIASAGIGNRVSFAGTVSEKDMPAFYRSLDVFCYTGSPECAGGSTASLSVLEAQSCQTPVIRSAGNRDEIVDGKTGYYIENLTPAGVSGSLRKFFMRPGISIRTMKKSARRHVLRNFSWKRSAGSLEKVIHTVQNEYEHP